MKPILSACAAALLLLATPPLHAALRISEFMADNASGLTDADGDHPDWLELENTGPAATSLDGWFLTDNAADLRQWRFPAVSLAPGARLVVFCSGKDRSSPLAPLHTSFSLDSAGEFLALVQPDGTSIESSFAPLYPRQRPDVSYGTGNLTTEDLLVRPITTGRWKIPTAADAASPWQDPAFNDSSWSPVQAAVGWQTTPSGPRPLAYWSFDSGPVDAISSITATLNGPASSTSFPSPIGAGNSLAFTSSDGDHFSAPLDVSETSYTASFWFRTSNPGAGLLSISDGELGIGGHDRHVYLSAGNIRARTWSDETIGSTSKAFADGRWHHAAHVYGGSQGGQKLYVDGTLVASGAKNLSNFDWQKRLHLGFSNDAPSQYLTGEIDDAAIFSAALTAAQVFSLSTGASPLSLSGVAAFAVSNTAASMSGLSSSAWLRVPFLISRPPTDYEEISLRVRYDDGFILALNGTTILSRNAPPSPAWNAAASSDRPITDAVRLESIDLTPWRHLFRNGTNLLAVHALNSSASSSDFLFAPELAALDIRSLDAAYMTTPTPGAPNAGAFAGFVDDVSFSVRRGWFSAPFPVTVSCPTPDATIAYTTNGSAPTLTNGTLVPPPAPGSSPAFTLNVTTSTTLRVSAFRPGFISGPPDSQSYLFASRVRSQSNSQPGLPTTWNGGTTADYGVDPNVVNSTLPGYSLEDALGSLPTLSITGNPADFFGIPNGVYYNTSQRGLASEKVVSVEFFNPQQPSEQWQAEAGIRSHGNSSRDHGFTPKHPLRLYFRRSYGDPKLNEQVFPDSNINSFNRLLLRGASTDSWPVVDGPPRWVNEKGTYMRDAYMRQSMRDLGNLSGHSRYVHLFLNGLYWGLYEITERPEEDFAASYLGGDPDEYDVIKDFAELASGNRTAWDQLMAMANPNPSTLSTDAGYWLVQGLNPDGSPHASAPPLLHMQSFIDYMILHIAGGAEDWPDHNYWAFRRRGPLSDGWHFIPWDQEISNDNTTRNGSHIFPGTFELVSAANSPAILYDRLRRGPAFRFRFRERVHALYQNGGPLSPPNNRARWAAIQSRIDKAIVAESARWGDSKQSPAFKRETTWLAEMNFMQLPGSGFWDVMWPRQLQRFRNVSLYPSIDQPSFTRNPGPATPGTTIGITAPSGTIYYTTDGSDPRLPNGSISPRASTFNPPTATLPIIPRNSTWRYLVTPSAPAASWTSSGFDDSSWPQGAGQLGYGDGDEGTVIGYGPLTTNRYMTTYFRRSFSAPADSVTLALRIRLLRDDGAVVYLNGREVMRSNLHPTNPITWASAATAAVAGTEESTVYLEATAPPALLVPGPNVIAVEIHKVAPADDDLSFDLALDASIQSAGPFLALDSSRTIRTRAFLNNDWSGLNSAFYQVDSVPPSPSNLVVSRIHYHPAEPSTPAEIAVSTNRDGFEFIELLNVGTQTIDLPGLAFTEGIAFSFSPNSPITQLAPGARVLVARNAAALTARYGPGLPIAGEFANDTGLSNSGESLTLSSPTGIIRQFAYDDALPWPSEPDGSGPSLVLTTPSPAAASDPWHNNGLNWHAATIATPGSSSTPSFSQWLAANPHPDDPDGDGRSALAEYAMGSLPLIPDAAPILTATSTPSGTQLTLTRAIGPQVGFRLESSPDLASWSPLPLTPSARSSSASLESISYLLPNSPTPAFFRTVFSLP
jgi:hypothetical protein